MRDFTVTAATDYRTRSRVVRDSVVRVYYRPGAPGAAMLDAAADAFDILRAAARGVSASDVPGRPVGRGIRDGVAGLIWIPTGVAASNLRYLAAHETAHQWFYGIVGNDQAKQPFADEAAADFAARYVLGLKRASRCATATPGPDDLPVLRSVLLREDLHPGRQPARRGATEDGLDGVLGRAARLHRRQPEQDLDDADLLEALDAATPIDLGKTLFAPRFPRIY